MHYIQKEKIRYPYRGLTETVQDKNFQKLLNDINLQIQETQMGEIYIKKSHIIVKLLETNVKGKSYKQSERETLHSEKYR